MTAPEFKAWPKTPRFNRTITITEKIDGTNAAVIIQKATEDHEWEFYYERMWIARVELQGERYLVGAQSRKRIIVPNTGGVATDNYGFAAFVRDNAEDLAKMLGEGYHYGEWWGAGIQHGYGLRNGERYFSLFNVNRYARLVLDEDGDQRHPRVDIVPQLYVGHMSQEEIDFCIRGLMERGSCARQAPGAKAEGVIVHHSASGQVFKVLCENDELPKGVSPKVVSGRVAA